MPQPPLIPSSDNPDPGAGPTRLRIIVTDDDRDTVVTLTALLRHEGHEVRDVYNGRDVLAAVRDFEPDAVILLAALAPLMLPAARK